MYQSRNFAAVLGPLLVLSSFAEAQSYPPAWSSTASYAVGDQVQLNGNVLRATRAVSPGSFKYAYWELWDVRANTTVLIGTGGQFPTLAGAWNYALNCRVAHGVYLHLYVLANHSETLAAPFSLDHPFGAEISIIGANSASDIFTFNGVDGFTLDNTHAISSLNSITVKGTQEIAPGTIGILATSNAVLNTQGVIVSHFDTGIEASVGGALVCGIGGKADSIDSFSSCGVYSTDHGLIDIESPMSLDGRVNGTATAQFGYHCSQAGEVKAVNCSASNCVEAQFQSDSASTMFAQGATADGGATGNGFIATQGGHLDATSSTCGNAEDAYVADYNGSLIADGSSITSESGARDYYAIYNSYISAKNAPVGAVYSPTVNTAANFNSMIYQ